MAKSIKKGDKVKVITGKAKGQEGEVLQVIKGKQLKLIVSGVNVAKKHQKPNQQNQAGGIIDMELSIDASNVKVV